MQEDLRKILEVSKNRFEFWENFINKFNLKRLAEIGVYQGEFAEYLLRKCSYIDKYYLIDPWKNLKDWNKPANDSNQDFQEFFNKTMARTQFAENKRIVLRGRTKEVIQNIEDDSLNMAYIDGDHTLRGITIDLINVWSKIGPNGFIGGDDFCKSIWQHNRSFEPTLVFPFSVYFAEAMNVKVFALPFNQFLISKEMKRFEFIDLTGKYQSLSLKEQFINTDKESRQGFYSRIFKRLK